MKPKWLFGFLVMCCMALFLISGASAADIVDSGNCGADGDNVTWTLDSDGVLTISGTGEMENYGYDSFPWYNSRESVKTVNIEDGVTSIGTRAFWNCSGLTSLYC